MFLAIFLGKVSHFLFHLNLAMKKKAIVAHVWEKYKNFSGLELSEMTHKLGIPWSNSYSGRGRNASLIVSDIQQHFIELALAGRQQTV